MINLGFLLQNIYFNVLFVSLFKNPKMTLMPTSQEVGENKVEMPVSGIHHNIYSFDSKPWAIEVGPIPFNGYTYMSINF